MKNNLNLLTSYISMLVMHRPICNSTEILKAIKTECERLKEVLLFSFNQAQERFQVTESINSCYSQLIQLADILWDKTREHNPIARSALLNLVSLIQHIEQHYCNFLDNSNAVSAFERFKLNNHLSAELKTIEVLLLSKKITEPLIRQLVKAFEDLFKAKQHPFFNCADRKYVMEFLPKLSSLANDDRDKDWNRRLRQLLIKNNFNHLGVYQFLEAENEKAILSIKDKEKQNEHLYHKKLWLEQIQPFAALAYNHQVTDLKTMLLKHMKSFANHLTKHLKIRNGDKLAKLKYKLSVDELSVQFHYEYAAQVYDYPSKKESATAFCQNNQSIGRGDISVNSFLNFDKLGQRSAALKYYQRINRIQKQLKEDFDL